MSHKLLVSPEWLHQHLHDADVVIADCRFNLADGVAGYRQYMAGHIPGACYFDLEKDLSGEVGTHGGRHPLPLIDALVSKLAAAGIDHTKTVVAYDDGKGAMAARLWWLLNYLGHNRVALLDGGYDGWVARGYCSKEGKGLSAAVDVPAANPVTTFTPHIAPHLLATVEDVRRVSARAVPTHRSSALSPDPATTRTTPTPLSPDRITATRQTSICSPDHTPSEVFLIDARAPERYRGEVEPLDAKAGHIPGAVNRFWERNLTQGGEGDRSAQQLRWKSPEQLTADFSFLPDQSDVIVYCGSGVTACANAFALALSGKDVNVKLYAGSWSDWISYPDNSVQKNT